MKTAQLHPLLVLTYTYILSEISPASTSFGVNLYIYFKMKTTQLPPLLVLIYTYFYSENSPAATSFGVNLHIYFK